MTNDDEYIPNWRQSNFCDQWSVVKNYINDGVRKGSNGQPLVCAYSHGITLSTLALTSGAYVGGVLTNNERIYLVPRYQNTAANWHYINTELGTVSAYTRGSGTFVPAGYYGGVLANNNNVYLVPLNQATSTIWHYINAKNGAVVAYTHGGTGIVTPDTVYIGGVFHPGSNRVYLVPYKQSSATTWQYIDTTTNTVTSYTHGVTAVEYAYAGGVLAPNKCVYLVPYMQATENVWHYIDASGAVVAYSHGLANIGPYDGGVLTPDGRIYFIPINNSMSTWHYIDTNTNTVYAYTHGITGLADYIGGVYAPDGRIYLIPYGRSSLSTWHYIETSTNTVVSYSHGYTLNAYAYAGGVLAPNGRIYLIPFQITSTTWHWIETNCNKKWNKHLCASPYFNKL